MDKRLLPMGSCRGLFKKREILEVYKLQEVWHGVSLDNSIMGCCQESSLQTYHQFHFTIRDVQAHPKKARDGSMYVGEHCGKQFRQAMQERGEAHPWPEFFSVFKTQGSGVHVPRSSSIHAVSRAMNLADEAQTIISLMFAVFPTMIERPGPLFDIYKAVQQNPKSYVPVKRINAIIGSYIRQTDNVLPLLSLVDQRAQRLDEEVREFEFPIFERMLGGMDVSNHIR